MGEIFRLDEDTIARIVTFYRSEGSMVPFEFDDVVQTEEVGIKATGVDVKVDPQISVQEVKLDKP